MAHAERTVVTLSNRDMAKLVGYIHAHTQYQWGGLGMRKLADLPDWYLAKYDFLLLDSLFSEPMRIIATNPEAELWLLMNANAGS